MNCIVSPLFRRNPHRHHRPRLPRSRNHPLQRQHHHGRTIEIVAIRQGAEEAEVAAAAGPRVEHAADLVRDRDHHRTPLSLVEDLVLDQDLETDSADAHRRHDAEMAELHDETTIDAEIIVMEDGTMTVEIIANEETAQEIAVEIGETEIAPLRDEIPVEDQIEKIDEKLRIF